jgi:hypothetical protein
MSRESIRQILIFLFVFIFFGPFWFWMVNQVNYMIQESR